MSKPILAKLNWNAVKEACKRVEQEYDIKKGGRKLRETEKRELHTELEKHINEIRVLPGDIIEITLKITPLI